MKHTLEIFDYHILISWESHNQFLWILYWKVVKSSIFTKLKKITFFQNLDLGSQYHRIMFLTRFLCELSGFFSNFMKIWPFLDPLAKDQFWQIELKNTFSTHKSNFWVPHSNIGYHVLPKVSTNISTTQISNIIA